jgi:hypothetical protein
MNYAMKNLIKTDFETDNLLNSKSKTNKNWTNYMTPGIEYQEIGAKKGKRKMNGNMDLLKKFRYNFHYWLKNCYQPGEIEENKQ